MRRRTFGMLYEKLPDLDTLSRMNRGAAVAGFVLMTVGLNIGIWWAHAGGTETFSYLDPKVLAAMVTWIIFGLIGASRWIRFLTGRRAALVAVGGVSLVFLTLLVSFAPSATFHAFG
jgi:ABC-type transport system involved in cytochrome c biogenesis permease subunit